MTQYIRIAEVHGSSRSIQVFGRWEVARRLAMTRL
jgi:hypothetical protein